MLESRLKVETSDLLICYLFLMDCDDTEGTKQEVLFFWGFTLFFPFEFSGLFNNTCHDL